VGYGGTLSNGDIESFDLSHDDAVDGDH